MHGYKSASDLHGFRTWESTIESALAERAAAATSNRTFECSENPQEMPKQLEGLLTETGI